jgi:hypothetical protein
VNLHVAPAALSSILEVATVIGIVTTEPAVGVAVAFELPTAATSAIVRSPFAACAGTTDKSPNPSEATATADTFFNEIVFTIFLSFSQIKDDLLSGW